MGNTPEGRVKRKVSEFLKEIGAYYEMPVPSGYGKSGLDYHGCFKGKYFAIETKAQGKQPTARQWITIRRIRDSGGMVFIIDGGRETAGFVELETWIATVNLLHEHE